MENIMNLLEEQLKYNSKKAKKYKNLYFLFEILAITMGCITTFLLMLNNMPNIFPAISSVMVILLKSISSFIGFQKHWITCRTLTENLKYEKRKYYFDIFEYKNVQEDQKNKLLAENTVEIINNGNSIWLSLLNTENGEEK